MKSFSNYQVYTNSTVKSSDSKFTLCRDLNSGEKKLLVYGDHHHFKGELIDRSASMLCGLTPENADALRHALPWLSPVPLGLEKSFGFGDRLGLATPGHIQAAQGKSLSPIFAQQSVRENARTGRTPRNVMDDALWGVFQSGWMKPWGADADHLKTVDVLEGFIRAGFTMFTVDPGDHVDQHADDYSLEKMRDLIAGFTWEPLRSSKEVFLQEWRGKEVPSLGLVFDERTLLKALIKYGRAIAHTAQMYDEIVRLLGGSPFDFEVSVDETETPTTFAEHYFIASELTRLGVKWTSLAPRFIGRFEKGVDYIGNLEEFDRSIRSHAEVARYFGNYKISLHSGSDKFSVYPSVNRYTNGKLHVKTAGTSYLEALRVVAKVSPIFFGEILTFARSRYEIDRATYHVSADLTRVPMTSPNPAELLDQFDARQVFHVTYGSVLDNYKEGIFKILESNEEVYSSVLKTHFNHHLELLD